MSLATLETLPDDARVWCFGATETPPEDAAAKLRTAMAHFLEEWTAHRAELRAGFDWLHDRFLVVAVDEAEVGASGCSIDALVNEIRRLEEELHVGLLDASPVWYRDATGDIRSSGREEFRRLSLSGKVDEQTKVFDLTIADLEAVRTGAWEVEAGRSWHARLL